jgi:hypothetical protein
VGREIGILRYFSFSFSLLASKNTWVFMGIFHKVFPKTLLKSFQMRFSIFQPFKTHRYKVGIDGYTHEHIKNDLMTQSLSASRFRLYPQFNKNRAKIQGESFRKSYANEFFSSGACTRWAIFPSLI